MGKYSRIDQGWLRSTLLAAGVAAMVGCAGPGVQDVPPPWVPPPARPSAPAAPEPVAIRDSAPLSYVVQPGDTLWDIAQRFLLDPWQWPEVWIVNDQVANPHRIYPGDVLQLVYVDGHARIGRIGPEIRRSGLDDAISTIPIEAIRDFLRGPRLATAEELERAPYLIAFEDEHIVAGAGDEVYVRRLPADLVNLYAAVRVGEVYRDPDDGAVLGVEAIPVAEVSIDEPGDPAVGVLVTSDREALAGDRLLPVDNSLFEADFFPRAPDSPVGGRVIAVFDGVSQIGQYQIVAINRGLNHGLEPGHVLQIRQAGKIVKDPLAPAGGRAVQLPDRDAGFLLVFKTTARLSYGLVMNVTRPVYVLDKVETPRSTR